MYKIRIRDLLYVDWLLNLGFGCILFFRLDLLLLVLSGAGLRYTLIPVTFYLGECPLFHYMSD